MTNSSCFTVKNSFGLEAQCHQLLRVNTIEELDVIPSKTLLSCYVLGEGSNTLFATHQLGNVLVPNFKEVSIAESVSSHLVKVGASNNWHQIVTKLIGSEIYGLENLALIPGSVGAAPVQNIGAYGVEVNKFIKHVNWYCFDSHQIKVFSNDECNFGYRDSIFKGEMFGKGLITSVLFEFPKMWKPVLTYVGLNHLPQSVSAAEVMSKVIEIRSLKLPDPKVLPNAGSFFKNPVVDKDKAQMLQNTYLSLPVYDQPDGTFKLAAGWLIEQCGLKGFTIGGAKVHEKQALVLVNYDQATGSDVIKLASHIQQTVFKRFKVMLEVEVRLLTEQGLQSLEEIKV